MKLLDDTPRLRMFAGPNGSGKSTIKSVIRSELLADYINPDDIEASIRTFGFFDFETFGLQTTQVEILPFFQNSAFLKKAGLGDDAMHLKFNDGKLFFVETKVNAYFASVLSDFIRQKMILAGRSFTFETVMSSPDKVQLLQQAQHRGYRTYLYFVATDSPLINISRVKHRVKTGGHDVPNQKIIKRYYRSLDLLWDAIQYTNRAYIFDNSGSDLLWLAEIADAKHLEIKTEKVPQWFDTYLLKKTQ
jgi:predicted ABC-type ATPase